MNSICGVNCLTDCGAFPKECSGCNKLLGKVPWAKFYGKVRCPIYDCAQDKGLTSCGDCGQAPCRVWFETRNPQVSEKEFKADIKSRLKNLADCKKETR
jgi:hypothetical protein